MNITIRKEVESDYFETEAMTRRAFFNKFAPGCDEHLMVHNMHKHPLFLKEFSRVAEVDGHIVGAIMYFMGEPDYYPRHGFVRAGSLGLTDGEGNVFDAFMAIEFRKGALAIPGGKFIELEDLCSFDEKAVDEFDKQFEFLMKAIRPCQWTYDNPTDEKEGYHFEYATTLPKKFEEFFANYIEELEIYDSDIRKYSVQEYVGEIRESVTDASYVVCVGTEVVGLFVSSVPGDMVDENECASYMQELYIVPQFRRRGIAKDIFTGFIKRQKQDTGFCMVEDRPSGKYFKRLLEENSYKYDIYPEDDIRVFCQIKI